MSHPSSAVHSLGGGGVVAAMWKASLGENLLLRESVSLGRSEDWPPRPSSLSNHLVPAEAMADSSPHPASSYGYGRIHTADCLMCLTDLLHL